MGYLEASICLPDFQSPLELSEALQWQVTRRGGQSEHCRGLCFRCRMGPGLNGQAVAWGSKMLSVIGSLTTWTQGPGYHLDQFVWFHSLAKATPGQP